MNITNFLLFNCSLNSIQDWKLSINNANKVLLYSESTSGNYTLSYQALSGNCTSSHLLRNKYLVVFPQITFFTEEILFATWSEQATLSDNSIGYGAYIYVNSTLLTAPFLLDNSNAVFLVPTSIQPSQGNIGTTWIEQSNTNSTIKAHKSKNTTFDSTQNILISNQNTGSLLFSTLVAFKNKILIAWQQLVNSTTSDWDVYAQFYDHNFSNISQPFLINNYTSGVQGRPALASTKNTCLIAWSSVGQVDNADIFFKILDNNGNVIMPETMANTYTLGSQTIPQVAGVNGVYGIVWTSTGQDGDQGGIFGQLLYSNGTKIGSETQLNINGTGSQRLPRIWVEDDNLAFGWLGPYLGRDVIYGAKIDTKQFIDVTPTQTQSVSDTAKPTSSDTLTRSSSETGNPTVTQTRSLTPTFTPTFSSSSASTAAFLTREHSRTLTTSITSASLIASETPTSSFTRAPSSTLTTSAEDSRTNSPSLTALDTPIISQTPQNNGKNLVTNTQTLDTDSQTEDFTSSQTPPSLTRTQSHETESSSLTNTSISSSHHNSTFFNNQTQIITDTAIIPKAVVKAVNTVAQVTSTLSFSLPNAIQSQRLSMVSSVATCQNSNTDFISEPLGWPDSPLQFSVGNTTLKYIDGALLGTWIVRVAAAGLHFAASKYWTPETVRYPGRQIFVTMFFYSSTTSLETTMFRIGETGEIVGAAVSSLAQLALPVIIGYSLIPSKFEAFVVNIPRSPWVYKKLQSILAFLPSAYSTTRWESLTPGYIKRLGDIFEVYKEGRQGFIVVEMLTSLSMGVVTGFTPQNGQDNCYPTLVAMTAIQLAYTLAMLIAFPYASVGANVLFLTINILQSVYLAVSLAQHHNPSLQNNTAVQNFLDVTPTIVQTGLTILSIIDLLSFAHSLCKGMFLPHNTILDAADTAQQLTIPLLEIVTTSLVTPVNDASPALLFGSMLEIIDSASDAATTVVHRAISEISVLSIQEVTAPIVRAASGLLGSIPSFEALDAMVVVGQDPTAESLLKPMAEFIPVDPLLL